MFLMRKCLPRVLSRQKKTIIQEIEEFLQRPDVDIKGDLTREKLVEMSVGARTLG